MTPLPPAIIAENLTRHFGDLTAVNQVSFKVMPGEIFGLVGPDGAGKTTTLRLLASIMDQSSGKATINGFDCTLQSERVREHLAYMSQRFGLYPDLTVIENITFYADLYGVPARERTARIPELLQFSNLHPFKKRRAADLSGGMKQKLQLACALVHTPKVLLLDEPTNGVDPLSRRDFWKILRSLLKQEVAILLTTAYLDEAERCDRVGLLDQGKLLAQGTPQSLRKLMDQKILAIKSPVARAISTLLKKKGVGKRIDVFGDTVHVICDTIEASKTHSLTLMEKTGLTFTRIFEAEPGLEDIFVSVVGKSKEKKAQEDHPDSQTDQDDSSQGVPDRPETVSADKTGATAVDVKDLTRRFKTFTAVDHLNFKVTKGEIFGFLGPNGAGKSTTIRMLCGLLLPSSGSGSVAGFDINSQAEAIKQHIGYMSQKFSLYEDLTVEENINFYGGIYGLSGKKLDQKKEWAVAMADLEGHEKSLTKILSGGWKQRLALACAILHEPPILFLDEPTSGVDPLSRRRFWDLIYAMADQGITIFVTTHYMEEAEYCDRIAMIYNGKMIALGTPDDLKTNSLDATILEIKSPNPQELRDTLLNQPGIRDAALFGPGLHIATIDESAARQSIIDACRTLGIRAERIEAVLPSMEDVFVSLIEAAGRTDDAKAQKKETLVS